MIYYPTIVRIVSSPGAVPLFVHKTCMVAWHGENPPEPGIERLYRCPTELPTDTPACARCGILVTDNPLERQAAPLQDRLFGRYGD